MRCAAAAASHVSVSRARSAPSRAAASAPGSSSSSASARLRPATSPGGHDPPGGEARDDLAQPADVVDDRGDAGAQRLEERPGLVELVAVGEDRDGRLGERLLELAGAEVAEAPLDAVAAALAELRERDARVAGDEQARVRHGEDGRDRVGEPLVRPDHARREDGPAVVGARRVAPEDGVRDHAQLSGRDTERDERLAAALGVDDDRGRTAGRGVARAACGERCGAAGGRAR